MSEVSLPLCLARAVGSSSVSEHVVSAGLAAAVPTAITGASDWAGMTGDERRIGAVHALGTDVAVFANLGSLIARTRGRHGLGVALALAGNAVLVDSGFLGGHMALNRGTARRVPADA